jgi:hypothetical protein
MIGVIEIGIVIDVNETGIVIDVNETDIVIDVIDTVMNAEKIKMFISPLNCPRSQEVHTFHKK